MNREIIGSKLKRLRMGKGMTQEELGNKLGVSKATVQKYESGQVPLTVDKIRSLCSIFTVYPRVFIYEDDTTFVSEIFGKTEPVDESLLNAGLMTHELESRIDSDVIRIVNIARTLNHEGRMRLYEHADVLKRVPEFRKEP